MSTVKYKGEDIILSADDRKQAGIEQGQKRPHISEKMVREMLDETKD